MIRLDKIYTRGGDGGKTSLGDGTRVAKDTLRVEAFGCVDEANAVIGCACLYLGDAGKAIMAIQNDLFDMGADLCVPEDGRKGGSRLRVTADHVTRLEAEIDRINGDLAPLQSFILPGGSKAGAFLHLARTVIRRAERRVATLADKETINPHILAYLNRLSDYLFVLARAVNADDGGDILWRPGDNIAKD